VKRSCLRSVLFLAVAVAVSGMPGCSGTEGKNKTVAQVNGDAIQVADLREVLGVRGGMTPAVGVPAEKKKEALDRLIAERLLEQFHGHRALLLIERQVHGEPPGGPPTS